MTKTFNAFSYPRLAVAAAAICADETQFCDFSAVELDGEADPSAA